MNVIYEDISIIGRICQTGCAHDCSVSLETCGSCGNNLTDACDVHSNDVISY